MNNNLLAALSGLNNQSTYTKYQNNLSQHTVSYNRPKRKSIFGKLNRSSYSPYDRTSNSNLNNNSFYNKAHGSYVEQTIGPNEVMREDFCGCEKQQTPCNIIDKNFIVYVNISQLKRQYQRIQKPVFQFSQVQKQSPQYLFKTLPKWYPQLYFTQLNNLIKNIYSREYLTENKFLCLSWIQYHCKIQYISYFFFMDFLKAYENWNWNKFIDMLDLVLIKSNTSYEKLKQFYTKNIESKNFFHFVQDYFQSLGASVIPLSQYAKFIELVLRKGKKVLAHLLAKILLIHQDIIIKIVKCMDFGQIYKIRNQLRQVDWQSLFMQFNEVQNSSFCC